MMQNATGWLILDLQFGSTGKGALAGYLALQRRPDTVMSAWAPNAGHTFIDAAGVQWMHMQIPNGAISPSVKRVMIGPGSVIDAATMLGEWERVVAMRLQTSKTPPELIIHPNAAVATHAAKEQEAALSRIGSTQKGVGAALAARIMMRGDPNAPVAKFALADHELGKYVTTQDGWQRALLQVSTVQIEGAQGLGLSMYHGTYPFVTSRDISPAQVIADCGIPWGWANMLHVLGTMRTFPIRVNNKTGSSGPGYPDQREMSWTELNMEPELTTVTKLPRRIFSYSQMQTAHAVTVCDPLAVFLNFCNYCTVTQLAEIIADIERHDVAVRWLGFGPAVTDIAELPVGGVRKWSRVALDEVYFKHMRQRKLSV